MSYIPWIKSRWEQLDEAWRVAIVAFLVARSFYAIWSFIILAIIPIGVLDYATLQGERAVLFFSLETSQSYTYLSEVKEQMLRFRSNSKDSVTDLQTRSVWDIYTGIATQGSFEGTILLPAEPPHDGFPYYLNLKTYPVPWLTIWQRWDANWYLSIAEHGYGTVEGDHAFPPLFPLLIRVFKPIFGNTFLSGLFISHVSAVIAFKLMFDTYQRWGNRDSAHQSLGLFLIFPTSFFLFSVYTETLFLVFVLLAMHYMSKHSWNWAGFWVFCATLTRIQGAALIAPLLYTMWKQSMFLRRFQHWSGLSFAGSGLLFYLILRAQYASGIVPSTNSVWDPSWNWHFVPPWEGYLYALRTLASGNFNKIDFLNWFLTTLFLFLILWGWRKLPFEYTLYVVFSLLIMLTRAIENMPLNSMQRYLLTLFPLFHVMNITINHPIRKRIVVYSCLALSLYLSAEFFSWGWVA